MKKLFVVVTHNGDGSSYACYTFNEEYILKLQTMYYNRHSDFDYERFADGDGFHYDVLTVPDKCTLESLGILYDFAK